MHEISWRLRPDGRPVRDYREHLRVDAMSVGTYTIPAGAPDAQDPHAEDEVYVVLRGRARLWSPTGTADAAPGSVLFVPAGEPHRFIDVREDLTVLVVFAPAESSAALRPSSQEDRHRA